MQRFTHWLSDTGRMKSLQDQSKRAKQQQRDFKQLAELNSQQQERKTVVAGIEKNYQKQFEEIQKRIQQRRAKTTNPTGLNNYRNRLQQYRQRLQQNPAQQQNPRLPQIPASSSNLKQVWNLRNADIRNVISEVSRQTGKKFIIDPRVQGKVTLIANNAINKKELYQVFLSMLEVAGYSAVDQGAVTKIIPNIKARYSPTPLTSNLSSARDDAVIARVIPVKYVAADQLVPVLRPLIPNWGIVNAYRPSNSVIVVGEAGNVDKILQIVRTVDTATHNGIDVVPLRYAIAADVVKTINELNTRAGASTGPKVNVASDDHSNSVLIGGPRAMRLRMKVLVSRLDNQSPSGSGNTQVVYLEYMQAKDIVPILAGVARSQFSGTVGTTIGTRSVSEAPELQANNSTGTSTSTISTSRTQDNQNQATQSQTSEGKSGPKIEIIAEPNTNAVILNAPPNIMRVLKSVIAKVDIRPAQVLVEALIAEVSENDIQNLGIEWGQIGTEATGDAGLFQAGFGFINKDFFHDLVGTIQFLQTKDSANILSTPSVVVLDNHLAHIKVGNEVSIISSSQPANASGTTTGTPFNTFDRRSVGLELNVQPQITKNNSIRLSISHQNNSPRNVDDTTGTQAFNISEIKTSVIVSSGDIVVLGGLTQNQYLDNTRQTPYLGDIPGFGNLLKRSQKTRNRKKLMVFLRPIILRSPHRSVGIANSKYDSIRDAQVEMMSKVAFRHRPQEYVLASRKKRKHLPPPFMPFEPNGYHK